MATPIISRLPQTIPLVLLALASFLSSVHARSRLTATQEQSPATFDSFAQAAAAARDAGHPAEAIPLYRRALALRPEWTEGWWYLGTLLYDADQFREAISAFQKILALAPDAPGALSFLGLCEFEVSDYDSALQHLEKAHLMDPQDDPQLTRVTSYHLALLLSRSGSFDRSLDILFKEFARGAPPDQVIVAFGLALLHVPLLPPEIDPSKDALLHSVGRLGFLVAQGRFDLAISGYPPLLAEYPGTPFLHGAYASALQSAGRLEEARAQLQEETKLKPTSSTQIVALYANDAAKTRMGLSSSDTASRNSASASDANWQQALQLFTSSRYAEAIPPLKAWLARSPDSGTAWAMLGLCEFETRDYDNALLHLQRGASLGLGGSAESVRFAKYRLALLLIRNGKFETANAVLVPEATGNSLAREIQFALGLALLHKNLFPQDVPTTDAPLVHSAGEISLLLHNSKYDLAFPKLEQLIASHPTTPMLHNTYGLALASFSRYEEAEKQFLEEAKLSPKSEVPYVQLAFVQLQARRPADALLSAQRAVQLAPNSAEAHYVLGRSYLDSGKWEDAARELQSAAQLNPGSPEVHFNLAKAYARLNREEDAARERALFSRLNEQIEKQRTRQGSQAYGAAHSAPELTQGQPQTLPTTPEKQ
jgi:tetratricopeptide (TPR) repeat protein